MYRWPNHRPWIPSRCDSILPQWLKGLDMNTPGFTFSKVPTYCQNCTHFRGSPVS